MNNFTMVVDLNNLFVFYDGDKMGGMAMHEFAIPVVHIAEVAVVLLVANKMIKYDEQEKLRFIELSHFPSTVDGSI